MKFIPFIILVFALSSCSTGNKKNTNRAVYSDVSEFIGREIQKLDSLKPTVRKYSEWNNEKDTDTLIVQDWETELALFKDINLPPAVWATDFELTDSLVVGEKIIRTLEALRPEQEVRVLRITTVQGEIQQLYAEMLQHNRLSDSERKMSYTVNKGYTVAGYRSTKMMSTESYKIVAQLLPKSIKTDSNN